jgi:eukaryotic-like serine/threonine-protein kinase
MSTADADRNLLFGILALQMDFVTRDALIAAMNAWALQKHKPLGQVLVERGALDPRGHDLLEPLVAHHVRLHGGDPAESLSSVDPASSIRDALRQAPGPVVRAGPEAAAASRAARRDRADTGATTGDGPDGWAPRFRILRPHAKGGLGEVFVARDVELNRQVALKEIQHKHADQPTSRARFLLEAEITGALEHPGIVPVYGLGHYPDGRPFYAMRLVRGDNLADAIRRFHRSESPGCDPGARALEFRKLLGRFVDVCNAIAYAHSRGVLHRDLKPDNVMLGKYGETLVVDWGLAKAIGRADPSLHPDEEPVAPSSSGSGVETLPGKALGTPAFMSPEQAAGELGRLGPQSDVYSLGATLYMVLTGRLAFEDRDVGAVLQKVLRGEYPPPRRVAPSVPRPLEAVCLKAMALKPGDRYATPRALAEDVERWLADEPVRAYPERWAGRLARWARRHRAWVRAGAVTLLIAAVLATAAALVVDRARRKERAALGRVGTALIAERAAKAEAQAHLKRSEESLRLARQAVDDYFTRISEDALLKRQDAAEVRDLRALRKQLLEVALSYYERFAEQHAGDPALRAELATAYFRVGAITEEIGSARRALEAHRRALAIREGLSASRPGDEGLRRALATSHNAVGLLRHQAGDSAGALESYQRARTLLSGLSASRPGDLRLRADLAGCEGNLAALLHDLGRRDEALEAQGRVLRARSRLAAERPDVEEFRAALAQAQHNMGFFLREAGRTAEALASYERARATWARLTADHPAEVQTRGELAQCDNNLGSVQAELGRTAEALASFERAREALARLVADHPTVVRFRGELAECHGNIATQQAAAGRAAEALESLERARATWARLTADHPGLVRFRGDLARCCNNIGVLRLMAGRRAEAMAAFEQARDCLIGLPEAQRSQSRLRLDLAVSYNNIAVVHREEGRTAEGLASAERALATLGTSAAPSYSELYERARAHGLCAGLAGRGPAPSPAGARDGSESHAARALDALGRAIAGGYRDAGELSEDPAFDSLRSRPDFRALQGELTFPADPFAH